MSVALGPIGGSDTLATIAKVLGPKVKGRGNSRIWLVRQRQYRGGLDLCRDLLERIGQRVQCDQLAADPAAAGRLLDWCASLWRFTPPLGSGLGRSS